MISMKALKLSGFIFVTVLFLVLFAVLTAGTFTPAEFRGKASGEISAPREKVWTVLTDIQGIPGRRPRTKKVEILAPNAGGLPVWKEFTTTGGYVVFEVLERRAPETLHVSIKESSFEMKGSWKYTLQAKDGHTLLTIEEDSIIESVPLRLAMALSRQDSNQDKRARAEFENLKKAVESR